MFGNEESTSQIRIRSVFDVVVKVQQSIKKRNIEAGKNVGNSSLWRLNNVKPSTQVVVNAVKPPTSSINIPRYAATRSRLLATRRSIVRITDHVKRGRSFFTPWTISMRSFPTIAMMMRPLKPAGLNGQYRHVSQYMPNSPAFQHRILGSSEGVFRKDIAQWMLHSS
ncbi:hypothetical protein Cni_G28325 [Canna indica]|uniref:Uncharacterized protein n=1 Tax=Canna indica TaxID=4628 RepID=A0AAQ3L2D4_9LILI|nr:hypothetical protein Cni_G28325 [Canna indica]